MPTARTDARADDRVVDIASTVDLDIDLTDDAPDDIPPFRLRLGGETFVLQAPDAGLVMELEEARTTRGFLALAFDDQWPKASPLIERLKDRKDLFKIVRQYGQHFELDQQALMEQAAPNRAERRRRRTSRR